MTRFPLLSRMSLLALAMVFVAGCNVGPKYVRPNYTAPPVFRGADNSAVSSDAGEFAWR